MTTDAPAPHPAHVVDATMFWSATGGGVRRYLQAKSRWMAQQRGWRHTIAAPAESDPAVQPLPALPMPGSGGYRLPWQRRALTDRLAALSPDLIEAGDPYRLAWAALDAGQRCGVPVVAFCHSNLERLAATLAGARLARAAAATARRYAAHLYSRFDLVLAPSQAMRQHLLDWGVPRVVHQPLGVDTRMFHPLRADPAWRASLHLPHGTRLLVYAGRFAPEKNLDVLAAAVDRLGPRYRLLALGAGPTPPPAGRRVIVQPFVGDGTRLAAMLASADAFVHAGNQETFGLAALEAMACGTPVVGCAAEGLAELVDEEVGMPVHGGDADAFADAITALFARDRIARAMAARRRAEAHDWRRVLPALVGHYTGLLRRGASALDAAA